MNAESGLFSLKIDLMVKEVGERSRIQVNSFLCLSQCPGLWWGPVPGRPCSPITAQTWVVLWKPNKQKSGSADPRVLAAAISRRVFAGSAPIRGADNMQQSTPGASQVVFGHKVRCLCWNPNYLI